MGNAMEQEVCGAVTEEVSKGRGFESTPRTSVVRVSHQY